MTQIPDTIRDNLVYVIYCRIFSNARNCYFAVSVV